MKRLAPIALALALLAPAPVAAVVDDWRPPRPDRLALLDAEMAPLLTGFQDTWQSISDHLTITTAYVIVQQPEAMVENMERRMEAVKAFREDVADLVALAQAALGVLDRHQPEPCFSQYWAVLMTGWLLVGDATQSLSVNDVQNSGNQLGTATYLLVSYGSLVWVAARADCDK